MGVRPGSDRGQTPISREVIILAGFAATVLLLCLFYLPFAGLWFLRFLLPAIPIAFLMSAAVVDHAARSSAGARAVALATFIVVAAAPAIRFADVNDMTTLGAGEERYIEPALHVGDATPADAVILAFHHSGNIRYYTGRLTLRWDLIDPTWIDRALDGCISAESGRSS